MSERFAIAAREEVWVDGRLTERRLMHGVAVRDGDAIEASDTPDPDLLRQLDIVWTAAAELRLSRDQSRSSAAAIRYRILARVTTDETMLAIIATRNGISVVTTPEHLQRDLALIPHERGTRDAPWRELPLLWRNGSAAVLLHEAIGHPLEQGIAAAGWPSWLEVDVPLAWRRESFRDVPLRRMTKLTATQHDAPFDLPARRIEIDLLAGGHYEALDDTVTLSVAAASLVEGETREPLAPFVIYAGRKELARSLRGAQNAPLRYPGVVCSSEGQELIVGSFAPVMVTSFR